MANNFNNQQKEKLPQKHQIIEHKRLIHILMKINVLVWDRHKNMAGLNRLMESRAIIGSPKTIQM
jgi:hypothetical protein